MPLDIEVDCMYSLLAAVWMHIVWIKSIYVHSFLGAGYAFIKESVTLSSLHVTSML